MNEIKFTCEHCGQLIETDEELSGRTVLCPSCEGRIVVPRQAVRLDPSTAVIVDEPNGNALSDDEYEEQTVLEVRPTARAYLGRIVFAIALPVVVLGCVIAFRLWEKMPSTQLLLPLAITPVAICALLLLSVWVKTASVSYTLTTERLFVSLGLLSKRIEEVELFRVKDVKVSQTAFERMLRYGDITVYSTDDSMPLFRIRAVSRPVSIKEELRRLYRAARHREKVSATEFIPS
ncbi:MAG: PH domain-containing protein [Candidatus Hydrogenedentes bacterium]|nr:PH domain-containing protein [Candidatus Hydrogenedentota bacterium]